MTAALEELSILMVVPSKVLGLTLKRELGGVGAVHNAACQNIEQAMEILNQVKPDLVISSMYFEDGTGVDLVNTVRAESGIENTLFVLISSEERFEMLDPIRQAGVIAILPKPFKREALMSALQNSLGLIDDDDISASHENIHALRVLLVNDNAAAANHQCTVLTNIGVADANILQTADTESAITVLESNTFDVVLSDYAIPQQDGEALLVYMNQQESLQDLPVIMSTSEKDGVKLSSIKSHGVTAMMDKPFEALQLKALFEAYL